MLVTQENWKLKDCSAVFSTDEGLVEGWYLKSTGGKPRYNFTRGIWRIGL